MKSKIKNKISALGVISFVILLLYGISLVIPMLWSLSTSFKDYIDSIVNPFGLPAKWVNNYSLVLKYFSKPVEYGAATRTVYIPEMIGISLIYAVGGAFISTTVAMVAAYIVAKFDFKFCKVIYVIVIVQMIIPIVGSLPSELRIARALGLYDSLFGVLVMKTYVTGMYFLIFYSTFKGIPRDYSEAAWMDGANNISVLIRIMIPMVKGVFGTIMLLCFISLWNDYQTPMIYMPNHPTLAYGLYYYVNGSYNPETSNVPLQLAGCMFMAVPLILLFCIFHKRLLSDVTTGGLKG